MKDLTLETLIAVLEEMFGGFLFWGMVVAAVLVTLAYVYLLVRDRSVSWSKFLWAQLAMPVGAIVAAFFVQWITHSGFDDIGGPIDLLLILGIAAAGAVGAAILVHTAQSLIRPPEWNKAP